MSGVADPGTYAKLPGGTEVYWAKIDADLNEAANLKLLKDADSVGATGRTAGFLECTRLIDTEKKHVGDMPDGPEKELVFLDDPADPNMKTFLAEAEAQNTVKLQIKFSNKRIATMDIALGAWSMQELDKSKPMYVVVSGKQNAIEWSEAP